MPQAHKNNPTITTSFFIIALSSQKQPGIVSERPVYSTIRDTAVSLKEINWTSNLLALTPPFIISTINVIRLRPTKAITSTPDARTTQAL